MTGIRDSVSGCCVFCVVTKVGVHLPELKKFMKRTSKLHLQVCVWKGLHGKQHRNKVTQILTGDLLSFTSVCPHRKSSINF